MVNVINNLKKYDLSDFYNGCKKYGFVNNISDERMKLDFIQNRFGNMWGLEKEGKLVACAACLEFPEVSSNAYRIQFRGCELPGSDVKKSLSKSHFNSSTFRELIPYQIEWARNYGSTELYLTTNIDNKNHRAMELIAKQGFLELHEIKILFNVEQAIWRFNSEKYLEERKKLGIYTIQHPPLI